ncbi:MAG: adenylyltransferase/cytidyltransferase family protein, partial [Acetobacteraceae bacterium]
MADNVTETRPSQRPRNTIETKMMSVAEVAAQSRLLRQQGKIVVQCHGTFDLLHVGHVRHLEAARALGDVLVVTLTADRFVNKGPGRPVFTETLRAEMLAALDCVSFVAIAEASDAIDAIENIRPSFYAKGMDYQNPDG